MIIINIIIISAFVYGWRSAKTHKDMLLEEHS